MRTKLSFSFPVEKAERVSIIEEEGRGGPSQKNSLRLRIGHHAIEILKLQPR
jgi:hypothetical protein